MLSFKQLIFTFYFCKKKKINTSYKWIWSNPPVSNDLCIILLNEICSMLFCLWWLHGCENNGNLVSYVRKIPASFLDFPVSRITRFCWFSRKTWHHQNHHYQLSWFSKGEGQPPKPLGISVILCSHWSVKFGIVRIQWKRAC